MNSEEHIPIQMAIDKKTDEPTFAEAEVGQPTYETQQLESLQIF